jgi:hypothetical protein
MSDSPAVPAATREPPRKGSVIASFGGMIGLAACAIGVACFLTACLGFDKAFALGLIPILMGAAGMCFTVVGGVLRHGGVEDTPILASIFLNLFALVGGLLLYALDQNWAIFPVQGK